MPTTLSTANGVATGCPPAAAAAPPGWCERQPRQARQEVALRGVRQPAGVADRQRHAIPDVGRRLAEVGIVKVPLIAPVVGATNGCVWVS